MFVTLNGVDDMEVEMIANFFSQQLLREMGEKEIHTGSLANPGWPHQFFLMIELGHFPELKKTLGVPMFPNWACTDNAFQMR